MRHHAVLLALVLGILLAGCTGQVRVEWTTETEVDTAGFNLLRGESPEGPFTLKVNEQLIPASPDPLVGGKYQFVDKTARPGVTYYYQLQEIEKAGGVNLYGPVPARSGGLNWRQAIVLVLLAGVVVALWLIPKPRRAPSS
jgi:hypothetical protein